MVDLAGYAAWIVWDTFDAQGNVSRASSTADHAAALGLDRSEPRIALAHSQTLAAQGRLVDAEGVAYACVRGTSTDSGFTELANWRVGVRPTLV